LGIRFGLATPTEVSAIAVAYGMVIAMFVYRALTLRSFLAIALQSGRLTGMVLFIVATAGAFGWTLTAAGLNTQLSALIDLLGNESWAFIIGSVVLMVVVGALLVGLPAL